MIGNRLELRKFREAFEEFVSMKSCLVI